MGAVVVKNISVSVEPAAVPVPSTKMYRVLGGLFTVTMGAAATPAVLSHPESLPVCKMSELDKRGVRHAPMAHSEDAKVVLEEQVDSRTCSIKRPHEGSMNNDMGAAMSQRQAH